MKIGPIHSLGIMQGRLLPKFNGRYQAHPVNYWQDEFALAANRNLDYIEFILDHNDLEKNPLMSDTGVRQIQETVQRTGVAVRSVCADYFMEAPLHSDRADIVSSSLQVLTTLIENASKLGITDIVIPCVDQSSLKSEQGKNRFVQTMNTLRNTYEKWNVNMALETDLDPVEFGQLLHQLPSEKITVNYDSGNSASLGYNVHEEFRAYGGRISDIHIKDRVRNGGSVFLGTGDADFTSLFSILREMHYKGIFVMQVYRDDEGVGVFDAQLQWLKETGENNI